MSTRFVWRGARVVGIFGPMRRFLLLALAALVACSSDPAPTRACTPGAQVACACPGGAASVQVCAADGSGLGACACSVADAGADAAPDARPEAAVDVQLQDVAPEASADVAADQVEGGGGDLGHGDAPSEASACVDRDGDGYGAGCAMGPDCDDTNRFIHPGAEELCDGADDNCDGRNDGDGPDGGVDAGGGVDPLADAHCARIWPYGPGGMPGPRCYPPLSTLPCGMVAAFSCVACRAPGDCFRQSQRPGETYDIRSCRP